MKSNHVLALAGCTAAALLAGWMIIEGQSVAPAPETQDWRGTNSATKTRDVHPATTKSASTFVQTLQNEADTMARKNREQEAQQARIEQLLAQEKLSLLYIVKCSACHGRDGKGPVGASIAGKNLAYNLEKLRQYKAGEVKNTMMADLLTRTSEEELQMLAREVSSFK